MAEHTPGPWGWSEFSAPTPPHYDDGPEPLVVYEESSGEAIAYPDDGVWPKEVAEANARLIAAAPKLMEALNDLMDVQNGPPLYTYTDAWNAAMAKARAAIAEAEGGGGEG
jgi:hypothetical protein